MQESIRNAPKRKFEDVLGAEIPANESPEEIKFPWDTIGVEGPDFNVGVDDAQDNAGAVCDDQ